MSKIASLEAYQILDSRSTPTLEVKITTSDGIMAIDSVPSGAKTGSNEATTVAPDRAVEFVNQIIAPKIIGQDPANQEELDKILTELDATKDFSKLGVNTILGVSLAVARAAANTAKVPLYKHINELYSKILGQQIKPAIPLPMMVMVEGGKHAKNNICVQEYLCISSLENGQKIWHRMEKILKEKNIDTKLGDEGGFAPTLEYEEDAIKFMMQAATEEGLNVGTDIRIGLDVSANECEITKDDIVALVNRYPIFSLEDPFDSKALNQWQELKQELDAKQKEYLLIGDDLFQTNLAKLEQGVKDAVANATIIKINQAGTLTNVLKAIAFAYKSKFTHIVSHRAGETMDTFISDLAVGTAAKFIKSGAPFATERMVKYNRLKEISQELNGV